MPFFFNRYYDHIEITDQIQKGCENDDFEEEITEEDKESEVLDQKLETVEDAELSLYQKVQFTNIQALDQKKIEKPKPVLVI